MQKSHVRGRASTIALAVLTIVCCVSLIIGATLAIFSSRQDNNISFTSGELKVETDITIADAWSYATDGGNGGTSVGADGTTVDFGSGTGTMTLDQETGSMTFTGVAPGDGVSLDLAIQNTGDINAMYIVKLTGTIPAELSFRMGRTNGTELTEKDGKIVVQSWSALAAGNTASVVGLVIEFPYSPDPQEAIATANFALTIEAVQANAFTPDEGEDDLIPSAADGTVLVSGIEGGAQVMALSKVISDYVEDQTYTESNPLTITLAEGTYKADDVNLSGDGFVINNASHVVLQGAGVGKTILKDTYGNNGQAALYIGAANDVTVRNLTVQAVYEEYEGIGDVAAVKVTTGRNEGQTDSISSGVTLENLELIANGNGHGIDINGAENVTIDNLTISGYGKAGIAYKNAKDVTIANVTFNGSEEDTPWSDIYDNNAASDTSSQNIVLENGIEFSGITFTVSILSHNAPIYALYHDGSLNISGYEKYNLAIDDTYSGYGIALISPAVVTVTDAAGGVSSYIDFADALAAVNKTEGTEEVTIALRGNTSVAANNAATITRDNVVLDGNGYTIDFGETNVSGQAALHVRANNVTVRNVTLTNSGTNGNVATLKYSFASNGAEISNGVIEDVVINANGAGHGLNLHGSNNVTVNRVDISNFGKVGIAIASAADIEISYTTFATDVYSAWANIGIMWADSDNYRKNTTGVVLGDGNVFCDTNPVIYNEEPELTSATGEGTNRVVSGYEQYGYTLVWRDDTTGTGYEIGTASYETADGNTYVSLATAVAASEGNPVTLTESTTYRGAAFPLYTAPEAGAATFSAKSEVSGSATVIDLGGNTLTAYVDVTTSITGEGSSLTIQNGTLDITLSYTKSGTLSVFNPQAGTTMSLYDVDYTTNGAALFPQGDAAQVNVVDSSITAPVYAVGTNASNSGNYGVEINIINSTITTNSDDNDNAAVLINVPGTLKIENSSLTSDRQALIVRGGTAVVKDSTLTSTGEYSDQDNFLDTTWKDGNNIPVAVVVVGNRSTAYQYKAELTLENTTVTALGGTRMAYVYGNTADAEIGASLSFTGGNLTEEDVTVGGGYVTINGQAYATAEDIEAVSYWLGQGRSVIVDGTMVDLEGVGTEESPFMLYDQEDLELVGLLSEIAVNTVNADVLLANPYYTIANDIAVDSSFEGFTYINGKFAGAEGDTKVKLDLSATTSGLAVDGFGDLSFSNLEFVSGGGMMVGYVNYYTSLRAYGTDVIFSNVTTSGQAGDKSLLGSNQSAFVSQVFYSNFTMEDCINGANIYCRYGSAFIGGYAQNSKVTFRNCTNTGTINAQYAAMMIGNDFYNSNIQEYMYNTNTYTVENCVNEGTITGTQRASLYIGTGGARYDETENAKKLTNGESGSTQTTGITGSVTVSEDGTISATYVNAGSYEITGATVYLYSYLTTVAIGTDNNSTLLTYYDADENATFADGTVTTSLKCCNVVDFRTAGVTDLVDAENATIDGIQKGTLDGETVYYVPENLNVPNFPLDTFEPLQVSQTATSITPTVAVYLYAGDMVVGILTK